MQPSTLSKSDQEKYFISRGKIFQFKRKNISDQKEKYFRSEGKIFQISIKNIFVHLECALLHDAGRVVLDAVAEVAGVGRVGGNLHPVHVELALDVAAAGVGGGGEVGEVSALSSN